MTGEDLVQRMVANVAQVDMGSLKEPQHLTTDDYKKAYAKAHEALFTSDIHYNYGVATKPSQIYELCTQLRDEKGGKNLDLIVVDYLGLLDLEDMDRKKGGANVVQDLAKLTRALKRYAMSLQCPIVLLCQMSRSIEKREQELKTAKAAGKTDSDLSPTPQLSDLRDSGSIEQDADIVMFLSHKNREGEPNKILLSLAKNRNGERDVEIQFEFDGKHQKFKEICVFSRGGAVKKADNYPKNNPEVVCG